MNNFLLEFELGATEGLSVLSILKKKDGQNAAKKNSEVGRAPALDRPASLLTSKLFVGRPLFCGPVCRSLNSALPSVAG